MLLCAKTIIIGDSETVLHDAAIRVEGDVIQAVGDAEALKAQWPEEEVLDYGDATIMPGLMDCHAHFGYYYSQPDLYQFDDFMIAFYAQDQAKKALQKGITTIRDVSSPPKLLQRMRAAAEKGYVKAPRILHTDAGICMTGGHGHDDGIPEVDGPWAIRKEIRRQIRDGADWVKILTSNRSSIPEYTQEELNAAVDESHRVGVKVAVHAGLQPAIQMCIDAGFDTIEHGTFLTQEQVEQMAANGQAWVPTMTAYTVLYEFCQEQLKKGVDKGNRIAAKAMRDIAFFEPAYNAYKNNFKSFYDTGVTVLTGTDMVLYGAPAYPIDREMALMVEYGITPVQAIGTATGNPARVLELADQVGTLKEGLLADLLVVEGDASEDIHAVSQVKDVYQSGKKVIF